MGRLKTVPSSLGTIPNRLTTANPDSWRAGKSSTQRGYDYRWQQEREQFLWKHPLCVMCQAEDRIKAATVVDHVIPHQGNPSLFWDRSNWQPLCKAHHDSTKQRMEALARA